MQYITWEVLIQYLTEVVISNHSLSLQDLAQLRPLSLIVPQTRIFGVCFTVLTVDTSERLLAQARSLWRLGTLRSSYGASSLKGTRLQSRMVQFYTFWQNRAIYTPCPQNPGLHPGFSFRLVFRHRRTAKLDAGCCLPVSFLDSPLLNGAF